jgi:hypothetical protein
MFQCHAIGGKERKKKNMPFRQNVVVADTFLDFQANTFPLLFKPKGQKFSYTGVSEKTVLMVYVLF